MKTSYRQDDVILLLKDVSQQIIAEDTFSREKKIQSGLHYSEMLPLEYTPTAEYMTLYHEALEKFKIKTAAAIKIVSEKILAQKGRQVVLVSLARAGLPIGILIKRYLAQYHQLSVPHYGVSIIRDRGIDHQAMKTILASHEAQTIQFVDGWTGKGAILHELERALADYPHISTQLAVLADPAQLTDLCGTHEDFLIPSACLNATVSGLISRTILNRHLIGPHDYHGAVYYDQLEKDDLSYHFIDTIEQSFQLAQDITEPHRNSITGMTETQKIAADFAISDINLIKPGVGETTRVLLRRVPWKILLGEQEDMTGLEHILRLAAEKNVPVERYPLQVYRACGLIKNMSADL